MMYDNIQIANFWLLGSKIPQIMVQLYLKLSYIPQERNAKERVVN